MQGRVCHDTLLWLISFSLGIVDHLRLQVSTAPVGEAQADDLGYNTRPD